MGLSRDENTGNAPYDLLCRLRGDAAGQDLVEYALLVAIVALGSIAALNSFKAVLVDAWTAISNNLTS